MLENIPKKVIDFMLLPPKKVVKSEIYYNLKASHKMLVENGIWKQLFIVHFQIDSI